MSASSGSGETAPALPRDDQGDIAATLRRLIRDVPDYPQPGVMFKDITPLLADPAGFAAVIDALAAGHDGIDKVAGIEARGFILAAPVALPARRRLRARAQEGKAAGSDLLRDL